MSTVETHSGVPCQFEVGTTLRFTDSDSKFPATAWTMKFVLNNGVDAPTIIDATVFQTSGFQVEISADETLTPGIYQWGQYFTAISPTTEKARGKIGSINALPSLADTAAPTFAEQQVARLEAEIAVMGLSQSRNFNGQSSSDRSFSELQSQLVYWQSRVIRERAILAAARGEGLRGGAVHFGRSPYAIGPYPSCGC